MPRLTWQFLEALDRLSRARGGVLPITELHPVIIRNLVSMGTAVDYSGGRLFITEPGKRLAEAYRLGLTRGRHSKACEGMSR